MVRQDWRYDTTLWGACFGRIQMMVIYKTCFKELCQYRPIHQNVVL